MNWLLHNPIADLPGPYFLVLYAAAILVTIAFCWWKRSSDDRTVELPPMSLPKDVDPYEIAFLRGGRNEVIRLAVFDLMQRGYLQAVEEKPKTSSRHVMMPMPDHPDPGYLSPLERKIFEWCSSPRAASEVFQTSEILDPLEQECAAFERRANEEALLCTDETRSVAWRDVLLGAAVIGGLGGYKLCVALAKGRHNLGFLLVMGVAGVVCLVLACKPSRLSRRGRVYLERLQQAFQRLKGQVATQATSAPDPTLLLLVGLFGASVLAGTSYAYFSQMFSRSQTAGAWTGGCSGGCGAASSCGGGCGGGGCGGGGCGGGCGGCGS